MSWYELAEQVARDQMAAGNPVFSLTLFPEDPRGLYEDLKQKGKRVGPLEPVAPGVLRFQVEDHSGQKLIFQGPARG